MTHTRGLFLLSIASFISAPLVAQTTYPYAINTLAGMGALGDGGPATSALLEYPESVAVNAAGKIFIGESGNGRIRVVNTDGTIQTFAFGTAVSMKVDSAGTIYATDGVSRVYKISPKGDITILAGSGVGYSGDNGPAISAKLSFPKGIAVDALKNVYIADTQNQRVRKITPDGNIQTVAGSGLANYGKEGVPALTSPLAYPWGVEVDDAGNLYISELYRIRKVNSDGVITTLAGNGASPVDGPAINTAIGSTVALSIDKGNLYFADADYSLVRMISIASSKVTTIAGSGRPGFSGDGTYSSTLNLPVGVAIDSKGNVFIADEVNQRIRQLTPTLLVSTVAGASHFAGDAGLATAALIHRPEIAIPDGAGNLIVSDTANNRVRKIDSTGVITTIAGNGTCTYGGDGGKAILAGICLPEGMAIDTSGNLYIADWGNDVVRRVDTKGIITTFAGDGKYGDTGSGIPTTAEFKGPWGLTFDAAGKLYISDNVTNRVRVVSNGTIALFAGNGTYGFTGDGGLATSAQLNSPTHVAAGPDGSIYIADNSNDRVRKVTGGVISSVLNSQSCCSGPAGAPNIPLSSPDGLVVDPLGNLFVAWQYSDVITQTTPAGRTSVVAGTGADGFSGDAGLALSATFSGPAGLSQDAAGDLYVADHFNNRIRKLTVNSLTGMSVASGDNQSGDARTLLKNPIVVALNYRGGVGIPGIPVTFTVTSGSATLSSSTSSTDALGQAGVAVTMGSTPGPVVITASAAGVSSVQFHLTAASSVPLPTISAGGIVGAGGSIPAVTLLSAGGFATIYGSNFAPPGTFLQPSTSAWPTNLGGVCVQVNGKAAYVTFVSPTQINFQVPDVPANTSVTVQVISNCGTTGALQSVVQSVQTALASPEFLYWVKNADGRNPVVAVNVITGASVAAAGIIPGLTTTPAKPGDILTVYGVSFGPTNPAAVPGTPPTDIAKSIYTPVVKLGTVTLDPSAVYYAGVSPGTAGLYQLNIQVPALPDGDYALTLTLGAFSTPAGGLLTVKN